MAFRLHELGVRTERTLVLTGMADLVALGVDEARHSDILYHRTQEIGAAAAFLGFDSLACPNARRACDNLVIFLDGFPPGRLAVQKDEAIDWSAWRARHGK